MLIYTFLFAFNMLTIPLYFRNHKFYLAINMIPLWVLMAFRDIKVGNDTIAYRNLFYQADVTQIPMHIINWLAPVHDARIENGFLLLNKIVYSISPNYRLMIVVTTTIMLSCLIFFVIKLNVNYIIGILTYESMFMPFAMNAMRQALALSVCMVAFSFLMQDRIIPFLLLNLLAASLHVTAWVFLITLIYKYIKDKYKGYVLLIVFTTVASLFFKEIYGKVSTISDEAGTFSNSVANNELNGYLNVTYSVIFIFLIIIWLNHYIKVSKIIENRLIRDSKLLLVTAVAFFIISLHFSQLSRLSSYFTIGYYFAFSFLSGGIGLRKERNMAFLIICIYLIVNFAFIQNFRPEWSGIVPYIFE